jgi:protoheme IX farnesyltransferase
VSRGSTFGLIAELAKARLTLLVLLTTAVGFILASPAVVDWRLLARTVFGTALLAGGAAVLNQYFERRLDALMQRTRDRPLPSGRIRPAPACALGTAAATAGLLALTVGVNRPAGGLGLLCLLAYLALYTPLKRITPLNTVVGAIPGAMPPLIGWVAAQGGLSIAGWSLFALQFFWQLPHFLAIAWLYREDYARAGFRMLPVLDPDGRHTGWLATSHAFGLLAVSLSPFVLNLAGRWYLAGAAILGTVFLALAARFARRLSRAAARQLFLGSIAYLPLLLGLMVWDKAR